MNFSGKSSLGLEISNIDLREKIYQNQLSVIKDQLFTYKVLVFKNQFITDEIHKNILLNFGELFVLDSNNPSLGSQDNKDSLIVVGNQATEYKIAYLGAQEVLPHSDHQWLEKPSSISALYAVDIAKKASPTIWYDMEDAYEGLSEELKRRIQDLKIITYNPFYRPFGSVQSKYVNRMIDIPPGEIYAHPLVRTHPYTGKKILYMNLAYEIEFEGLSYADGYALYTILIQHIESTVNKYQHNWSNNDLVIWDNMSTLHYRPSFGSQIRRVLKRVSVAGETPK